MAFVEPVLNPKKHTKSMRTRLCGAEQDTDGAIFLREVRHAPAR